MHTLIFLLPNCYYSVCNYCNIGICFSGITGYRVLFYCISICSDIIDYYACHYISICSFAFSVILVLSVLWHVNVRFSDYCIALSILLVVILLVFALWLIYQYGCFNKVDILPKQLLHQASALFGYSPIIVVSPKPSKCSFSNIDNNFGFVTSY